MIDWEAAVPPQTNSSISVRASASSFRPGRFDSIELLVDALGVLHERLKERHPRRPRTRTRRMNTRWLCLRPPEHLDEEERNALQRVLGDDPPLAGAHALMQRFRQVVRDRDLAGLNRRLGDAVTSELAPFVGFTRGIAVDRDAVDAAFTSPWSTGPVEGHVHKIKLLNRQAFGRAGLPCCALACCRRHNQTPPPRSVLTGTGTRSPGLRKSRFSMFDDTMSGREALQLCVQPQQVQDRANIRVSDATLVADACSRRSAAWRA